MIPSRLIKKVQTASAQELIFRLTRKIKLTYDQHLKPYKKKQPPLQEILRISNHGHFKTSSSYKKFWDGKNTFYFSMHEREATYTFLSNTYPQKIDLILEKASSICKLEVPIFNKKITYSGTIDWHKDPVGNKIWPLHHWNKIKVVDTASGADPKFVWELNRHQFLLYTAMAFWFKRQENHAEFTLKQITDWINTNPIDHGINWVESLEVATRLISWIWILELLRGSTSLTSERLATIVLSMHAHAQHIQRYWSHFISPNTHLTGEALALFLFAAIYPEAKQSQQWENEAKHVLDEEMLHQVGTDGVHKELSTAYHTYTVDYYFQYLILCHRYNKRIDPDVLNQLEKMCDFILFAERPDGSIPLIGDNDGGSALPLDPEQSLQWKDLLCNGAFFFNRPDFKYRSPAFCWNSAWLLGENARNKFSKIPSKKPKKNCANFADSNYIVYRSDWSNSADYLLFDAGKMGFLSAGHSHADYLNFELVLSGKPYLSDVGTLSYHDKKWRQYCRGTQAHNTIVIDNQDQAIANGSFSWDAIPDKGESFIGICQDFTLIQGKHKSYLGITHTRSFIIVKNKFLLCFDRIIASGQHHYEFNYHFDADVTATIENKIIHAKSNEQENLVMNPLFFQSEEISIDVGSHTSGKGFHFPTYGEKIKTDTVSISEKNTGNFSRGMLMSVNSEKYPKNSFKETQSPNNCHYSLLSDISSCCIRSHLQSHQIDVEQKITISCDFLIELHPGREDASFFAVGVDSFRCEDIQLVSIKNKLNYLLVKRKNEHLTIFFAEDDQLDTGHSFQDIIFQIISTPR